MRGGQKTQSSGITSRSHAAAPQCPAWSLQRWQKRSQTLLVGSQAACTSAPETPRGSALDEGQTPSPEWSPPPTRRTRPLTERGGGAPPARRAQAAAATSARHRARYGGTWGEATGPTGAGAGDADPPYPRPLSPHR